MALIKFGMVVSDARGKLGGQVFSKNRQGSYVRTKVTPVNAQTPFQQAVRDRLASFSAQWRALSEAQRNAWNAAAPAFEGTNVFGDTVAPTGKNLFTRLNMNLVNIGNPPITEPPTPAEVNTAGIQGVTAMASGSIVLVTLSNEVTGSGVIVSGTAPLSAGINFFKNRVRQIDSLGVIPGTELDESAQWSNKFGELIAGQKLAFKLVFVNATTGQASPPVFGSTIIGA